MDLHRCMKRRAGDGSRFWAGRRSGGVIRPRRRPRWWRRRWSLGRRSRSWRGGVGCTRRSCSRGGDWRGRGSSLCPRTRCRCSRRCWRRTTRRQSSRGRWTRRMAALTHAGVAACFNRRRVAVHAITVGETTLVELRPLHDDRGQPAGRQGRRAGRGGAGRLTCQADGRAYRCPSQRKLRPRR